jgi:ribosomal protein S18 acetylase RimI-like enzyme
MRSENVRTMFVQPPDRASAPELTVLQPRTATESDTVEVFRLATEVFGARQFLYTVYQAPQSVKHVERIIASKDPQHPFIVIRRGTSLVGYYEGLLRDREGFLSYIATDPRHEGQGIGSALFRHFEESARESGCGQLSLDVFQSNDRACVWYSRLGFDQERLVRIGRVGLQNIPYAGDITLEVDPVRLEEALSEEIAWGFSRIDCACGAGRISLGLIDGRICKLLGHVGIGLEDALAAIASRFRDEREVVVFSFPPLQDSSLKLSSSEAVIRLRKRLD